MLRRSPSVSGPTRHEESSITHLLSFRPTTRIQPTAAREVYDVSGAGDTVIATLATLMGARADISSAVRIANRAAGIVVGKLGTAVVHPDELA